MPLLLLLLLMEREKWKRGKTTAAAVLFDTQAHLFSSNFPFPFLPPNTHTKTHHKHKLLRKGDVERKGREAGKRAGTQRGKRAGRE